MEEGKYIRRSYCLHLIGPGKASSSKSVYICDLTMWRRERLLAMFRCSWVVNCTCSEFPHLQTSVRHTVPRLGMTKRLGYSILYSPIVASAVPSHSSGS
jgi:hypothetical protein